jgi:hypothetical protein
MLIGGTGSNRTLTLTPAQNQSGSATLTLTVVDSGAKSNSTSFSVTVTPTNTFPVVSVISNQCATVGTALAPISFTIGDLDTAAASLVVTASSANATLLPSAGIILGGSGSNRTVTLLPTPGEVGHTAVTLSVSDGSLTTDCSFLLSILPSAGTLLYEPFTYANGPLITNSQLLWHTHSGTTGEIQVVNGTLYVSADNGEDVNARLRGEPYIPSSGTNLYYSLKLSAYDLPSPLGAFFAHFKDNGVNFRGRLFASSWNAPIFFYRLGIANGASYPTNAGYAEVTRDITFDETNLVVVRYNVGSGITTLWLNPANEASPSVSASDMLSSTNNITQFAIRESAFQGNLYVDDIRVTTTFTEALGQIALSVPLRVRRAGGNIEIAWSVSATGYSLQYRSSLTSGSWLPVVQAPAQIGSEKVLTLTVPSGSGFYRLIQ